MYYCSKAKQLNKTQVNLRWRRQFIIGNRRLRILDIYFPWMSAKSTSLIFSWRRDALVWNQIHPSMHSRYPPVHVHVKFNQSNGTMAGLNCMVLLLSADNVLMFRDRLVPFLTEINSLWLRTESVIHIRLAIEWSFHQARPHLLQHAARPLDTQVTKRDKLCCFFQGTKIGPSVLFCMIAGPPHT
jgi:hypothetical protein